MDHKIANAATKDVVTVTDNGLMSAEDKLKLNGIANGANNYTHPNYTEKSFGLYKVSVDSTGHVNSVTTVTKADITTLGIPGQDTNTTYNNATTGAAGLMSSADKIKLDSIATGANKYTHPTYTAKTSGLYKVSVDGTGHVNGTTAVTKTDITALGIPSTNTTYGVVTTSANGLMSAADKTKLNGIATGAQKNTITGIKGNAESAYRTGNVNITPGNIGCGDFVVSYAVSGDWTYCKWNSGRVEMWLNGAEFTATTATAVSKKITFPVKLVFTESYKGYNLQVTPTMNGSILTTPIWDSDAAGNNARSATGTTLSAKKTTSNHGIRFDVYINGRWK